MHISVPLFTSLLFLPHKISLFLILSLFFLSEIKSKPTAPTTTTFVFRPYPLSYSHLHTLIYFLSLLNLRGKNSQL